MVSNIGLKIANGEFYPLLEENSTVKKRLVLTTVHDNQPSVQIDLFRSSSNALTDAQYIGSLVVENIMPMPKGEPSIEMIVSSNENGEIIADAIDLDTGSNGEHYVLTVSLKSLDETARDMEIPDFELESGEEQEPPSGLYNQAEKVREEEKSSKTGLFVLLGILIILGLLAAWLFFLGGLDTVHSQWKKWNEHRSEQASQPEPAKQPEPAPQPAPQPAPEPVRADPPPPQRIDPPPVIVAPVEPVRPQPQASTTTTTRRRPSAPVSSYNVPATIPREGVDYRIRWGDTLWDIAEAFYRDPWLYPRIARHNNIRNPNLIISGRTIRIPPKN
jgi:outer membrane biosynthesis protein TonB